MSKDYRTIEDEYEVFFKEEEIGEYYIFDDGSTDYCAFENELESLENENIPPMLKESFESEKEKPYFKDLMKKSRRAHETRKTVYAKGDVSFIRVPKEIDRIYIYKRDADDGDPAYDEDDHSAPHCEGSGPIEGMSEWASWYCFNKMDDGTYEAELDEAWCWGGGHNDGGTIRVEIPEEWQDLAYDEFLERVITAASARHYGFTVEHLKRREGLKKFFGFEE